MKCDLHHTRRCSGGVNTYGCRLCSKTYSFCDGHTADGAEARAGHGVRVHPAENPDAVDALRKNPEGMRNLAMAMRMQPEMWKRLWDYIDELERKERS